MRARSVVKAVFFASLNVLLYIVIPKIVLGYMPEEALPYVEGVIDLEGIVAALTMIGVIKAILVFPQNLTEDGSPLKLFSSVTSSLVGFYLSLFMIGLGDPSTMGTTTIAYGPLTITLDLTFFISLYALLLVISIVKAITKFYYARRERPPLSPQSPIG